MGWILFKVREIKGPSECVAVPTRFVSKLALRAHQTPLIEFSLRKGI